MIRAAASTRNTEISQHISTAEDINTMKAQMVLMFR